MSPEPYLEAVIGPTRRTLFGYLIGSHLTPRPRALTRLMKHSIVAVVLDAGTDAGLATAHSLLADGHRVVVTARQAGPLVRITHGYPADRVYALAADTHDRSQLDQVLALSRARFGRVDMIVDPALYRSVLPASA